MQDAVDETLQWVWQEAESIDNGFLNKVRDAGIKIIELSDEDMAQAKSILYDNEWPYMEEKIGSDIMKLVREIADIR